MDMRQLILKLDGNISSEGDKVNFPKACLFGIQYSEDPSMFIRQIFEMGVKKGRKQKSDEISKKLGIIDD